MNAALLLMLLGTPAVDPAATPAPVPVATPAAAMLIGEPPASTARAAVTPELQRHADGGVSIVFPEGYLMRTTLRRGFNGVWFTDCGSVPTRPEAKR